MSHPFPHNYGYDNDVAFFNQPNARDCHDVNAINNHMQNLAIAGHRRSNSIGHDSAWHGDGAGGRFVGANNNPENAEPEIGHWKGADFRNRSYSDSAHCENKLHGTCNGINNNNHAFARPNASPTDIDHWERDQREKKGEGGEKRAQTANGHNHLPFKQYTNSIIKEVAAIRKNSAPGPAVDFPAFSAGVVPWAQRGMDSALTKDLQSDDRADSGISLNSPKPVSDYCEYCFSFYARQCYAARNPLPHVRDPGPWNQHLAKDAMGRVTCPLLSVHMCVACGGVGPNSHKSNNCPLAGSARSPVPLDLLTGSATPSPPTSAPAEMGYSKGNYFQF